MAQKPTFYVRLDYRAIYIGYRYPNNDGHEINYNPSGYEFMQSTIEFIRKKYNILIGRWAVEELLIKSRDGDKECIEIKGRSLSTGLPDAACVSLKLINDNLNVLITGIASTIALNLKHIFPHKIYAELLISEFLLEEGDFPLPLHFISTFEDKLSIPITPQSSNPR